MEINASFLVQEHCSYPPNSKLVMGLTQLLRSAVCVVMEFFEILVTTDRNEANRETSMSLKTCYKSQKNTAKFK